MFPFSPCFYSAFLIKGTTLPIKQTCTALTTLHPETLTILFPAVVPSGYCSHAPIPNGGNVGMEQSCQTVIYGFLNCNEIMVRLCWHPRKKQPTVSAVFHMNTLWYIRENILYRLWQTHAVCKQVSECWPAKVDQVGSETASPSSLTSNTVNSRLMLPTSPASKE